MILRQKILVTMPREKYPNFMVGNDNPLNFTKFQISNKG
jgi:hypothetical protein